MRKMNLSTEEIDAILRVDIDEMEAVIDGSIIPQWDLRPSEFR